MKKANIFITMILLFGISPWSHAVSLMRSFSYCDSTFFEKLNDYPVLKDVSDTLKEKTIKDNELISVDLNFSPTGTVTFNRFFVSHTNFNKYDNFTYMGMKGQYYFWGFETNQSIDDVINYTSKKIAIIKVGKNYIYSPMVRYNLDGDWVYNELITKNYGLNAAAAEKMMIIEPDERRGVVRFICTLQGNVTEKDLELVGLD